MVMLLIGIPLEKKEKKSTPLGVMMGDCCFQSNNPQKEGSALCLLRLWFVLF